MLKILSCQFSQKRKVQLTQCMGSHNAISSCCNVLNKLD